MDIVLLLGDSLSAGYGMPLAQSWPAQLAERLQNHRPPYRLVNASISGETTAGGRSRLPALLTEHRPYLVIIALGANDGLRGLSLSQAQDNLRAMIRMAKEKGSRVLLIGMRLPPNYGLQYSRGFSRLYEALAREEKVPLLPFLLEPIALDANAFQADHLHPTAAAQPLLLEHVWQALAPLLKEQSTTVRRR